MSVEKRPLKVFLCYTHADLDAVCALYTRLTNEGVDAWQDEKKLLPGQKWELEIPKAIREADVVIVCLSEKAVNKEGYVQKEIKFALDIADLKTDRTIFIIPARLGECEVPVRLSKFHWVDLFEDNGYEKLMSALRQRASNIGATLQVKRSRTSRIDFGWSKFLMNIRSRFALVRLYSLLLLLGVGLIAVLGYAFYFMPLPKNTHLPAATSELVFSPQPSLPPTEFDVAIATSTLTLTSTLPQPSPTLTRKPSTKTPTKVTVNETRGCLTVNSPARQGPATTYILVDWVQKYDCFLFDARCPGIYSYPEIWLRLQANQRDVGILGNSWIRADKLLIDFEQVDFLPVLCP